MFGEIKFSYKLNPNDAASGVELPRQSSITLEVERAYIANLDHPPSSYVAFKFLDFEESATKTIVNNFEPEFRHVVNFPLPCNTETLAQLSKQMVDFFLIDEQDPDTSAFLRCVI